MTRTEIQDRSIDLIEKNNRVLLSWATGVGKSYAFIKMQEFLKAETTWIVVAEVAHIKNWQDEYIKHGKQKLLAKTNIFCYASLKNNTDYRVDLLCLDEGHHATSELRLDFLSSIKATKVVVLTATLGDEKKLSLESIYGKFEVSKVTLKQAIEWEIIPKPDIFIIPLELDNILYNTEIEQVWGIKAKRVVIKCKYEDRWEYLGDKIKYPNVQLIMSATQVQKNFHLNQQSNYWKNFFMRSRQDYAKTKWMLTGSERKRFLANCKTDKVKPFIKKLKKRRYICFCGSIEQAELLGGKNAIHSKMDEGTPAESIEDFSTHRINNLYVVGMLQEGQNLPDIEAGVIIQLDGQDRGFIQKSGRALRADKPILFIFYYKNTRDEEYLNNIIEDVDPEYIRVITDVEELDIL